MGHILTFKHGHGDLYRLVGPFAMSREVHRELSEPVLSTEGMVWFVAVEGRWPSRSCRVLGFCSLRITGEDAWYGYAYVVPEARGKGLYGRLWEARQAYVEGLPDPPATIRCVIQEKRWPHYAERGFRESRRRGQWVYAERSLKQPIPEPENA